MVKNTINNNYLKINHLFNTINVLLFKNKSFFFGFNTINNYFNILTNIVNNLHPSTNKN